MRTRSNKNVGGRKTAYKQEYALRAKELCRKGATTFDLAYVFSVPHGVIMEWQVLHEDFSTACNVPLEVFDEHIALSLAARAKGYYYRDEEVVKVRGGYTIVEVLKHMPPDVSAGKFWLERHGKGWNKLETVDPEVAVKEAMQRLYDSICGTKLMPNEDQQPYLDGLSKNEGEDEDEDEAWDEE